MKTQFEITPMEWDLIETYLNQSNTSDKETMWNRELIHIPHIEEKTVHVKKVSEEIEDSIRKSKIKEFHAEGHSEMSVEQRNIGIKNRIHKKSIFNPIWYFGAAVLVALFGIFWMLQSRNTPEKIFAAHFKPDIGLPLKMNTTTNKFYEGMVEYKQENYMDAIAKWQILLKTKPENDTLNYFLGVANLALGKSAEAWKYLKNQDRFKNGMFEEDAAYYAALSKIKEGKFEEARQFLENAPSDRNRELINVIINH